MIVEQVPIVDSERWYHDWLTRVHNRRLCDLDSEELKVLIPPRVIELVSDPINVVAVRFNLEIGRFDQEYEPSLSLAVIERNAFRDPVSDQEFGAWSLAMNDKRTKAIEQGLITDLDRGLIVLIAHDGWSHLGGVKVEDFLIAEDLRGKGIGRSFYLRFEQVLRAMGYRYLYGNNGPENIDFFLNLGRYTVGDLNLASSYAKSLTPEPLKWQRTSLTIKFFDEKLERECVMSECLKE